MTVRLRESAPGVYRLDHDTGQRDDGAASLGLVTELPEHGIGVATVPGRLAVAMRVDPRRAKAGPRGRS